MTVIGVRHKGFSLIEVLVALTIVSLGLLGVMGLQTHTQKVSSNAYHQTQAVILMHDMGERIRANSVASQQRNYHLVKSKVLSNCKTKVGCKPINMAQNDLFEWQEMIKQQLPQGQGIVCIDSSPYDGSFSSPACDNLGVTYTIKLWWHDTLLNKTQRSVLALSAE